MERHNDIGGRAVGMMQTLAPGDVLGMPKVGADHGLVKPEDGLMALAQVFAVVDNALQSGRLTINEGKHAMQMLMVARERICPIPDPVGDEALFQADLHEAVEALRAAAAQQRAELPDLGE
jgi:hypothetical protein